MIRRDDATLVAVAQVACSHEAAKAFVLKLRRMHDARSKFCGTSMKESPHAARKICKL